MCWSNTDTAAFLDDSEDRMHAGGDILQDCSSEHSSLTKTDSDPPGDLSLPGESSSVSNNHKIIIQNCSKLETK